MLLKWQSGILHRSDYQLMAIFMNFVCLLRLWLNLDAPAPHKKTKPGGLSAHMRLRLKLIVDINTAN